MKNTNITNGIANIFKTAKIGIVNSKIKDVEKFLSGNFDQNDPKMDHIKDLKSKLFSTIPTYGTLQRSFAESISAGHLIYQLIMEAGENPWKIAMTETSDEKLFRELLRYMYLIKKHPDDFREMDKFSLYEDDIRKYKYDVDSFKVIVADDDDDIDEDIPDNLNSSEKLKKSEESKDYLEELKKLVDFNNFILPVLKDKQGKEIDVETTILSHLEKLEKAITDDNISSAKNITNNMAETAKSIVGSLIDSVKTSIISQLENNLTDVSVEDQVKSVFTKNGFNLEENKAFNVEGLTNYKTQNSKCNMELNVILDANGIYCNRIPKLFFANEHGIVLFAIAINTNTLDKLLTKLVKSKNLQEIIEDRDIKKVVTQDYLNLMNFGVSLFDKVILDNNKKIYSLVKSKEWKSYMAFISCNNTEPKDKRLTFEEVDDSLVVKNGNDMTIFTIVTKDGKDIVSAMPDTNSPFITQNLSSINDICNNVIIGG